MQDDTRFVDLGQLSKLLCLSKRTLRSWVHDPTNPLPAFKIGGKLIFKWSDVERWIEGHRVRPFDVDSAAEEIARKLVKG
jgi:excisionase family DNA binding protein